VIWAAQPQILGVRGLHEQPNSTTNQTNKNSTTNQTRKQHNQPHPKSWAEALLKIARMTLTIKLDGNWSSFQLANSAPPLSVTDSALAPSARIGDLTAVELFPCQRF